MFWRNPPLLIKPSSTHTMASISGYIDFPQFPVLSKPFGFVGGGQAYSSYNFSAEKLPNRK